MDLNVKKIILQVTSLNQDVVSVICEYLIFYLSHIQFPQFVYALFIENKEIIAKLSTGHCFSLYCKKKITEKSFNMFHTGWRSSREKDMYVWKKNQDHFEIYSKFILATAFFQIEVFDENKTLLFFSGNCGSEPEQIFVCDLDSKKFLVIYQEWLDSKTWVSKSRFGYLDQMDNFFELPAHCKPSHWDAFAIWKNMVIISTGTNIIYFDLEKKEWNNVSELSYLFDRAHLRLFSHKNRLFVVSAESVYVYE